MSPEPSINPAILAEAAVAALREMGLREVVFCGGARNAALAEPLLASGLRLWTHFDERAAAFFALGRCRDLEAPVAVVVTSGTAVAECLAAVVEAHYQALPLVVVSADRPRHFRGSGAPQTIEQPGMFAPYAAVCVDAATAAELDGLREWRAEGPLHLNLCLEEPGAIMGGGSGGGGGETLQRTAEAVALAGLAEVVEGEELVEPGKVAGIAGGSDEGVSPEENLALAAGTLGAFVNPCGDGELLVLVGDLRRSERAVVLDFLHRLQAPFWAEASSGVREEPALAGFRLDHAGSLTGPAWRRVLRVGGVPSCRFWRDLEAQAGPEVLSVSRSGHRGLAREAAVVQADLAELLPVCGVRRQGRAVAALRGDREQRAGFEQKLAADPAGELAWMRAVAERIPPDSLVYLGNSLPIRHWAEAAPRRGKNWEVHASRGANGIDGQLATFLGLAAGLAGGAMAKSTESGQARKSAGSAASEAVVSEAVVWTSDADSGHKVVNRRRNSRRERSEPGAVPSPESESPPAAAAPREAWAILGDLTSLYDVSSLLLAQQLDPQLPLRVVVIHNGGGGIFRQLPGLAGRPEVLRLIENRHNESLLPWARAAGWKAIDWAWGEELPPRLPARVVLEVRC